MEEFGAGSRPEGVKASLESALEFIGTHGYRTKPNAIASATTIAIAAKARMTFRQFGLLGGGC